MQKEDAYKAAKIFGGTIWQPYPGLWQLVIEDDTGNLAVIDSDVIRVFEDEHALEEGEPQIEIHLEPS
jgi:hypothetical protein